MTSFRLATEEDDALLRAMLRENGMPTWVEMTMEREPSFFAGKNLFGRDWAVIASEGDDVIGMYTASVMPVHLNGAPTHLGYLGGLRVNPRHRRRIRYLREGYASIPRFAPQSVPWWFTVVAKENEAARRLLERGVPGLPPYHPQGDYVTFALPVSRGKRRGLWRRANGDDVVSLYNKAAAHYQYSPVLDHQLARQLEFYVCGESVAALWDQRAFKQIVARRYRHPMLIPLYNAFAHAARRIPLPREGRALDQTFIAFLSIPPDVALLEDLLSHCKTPVASLGVHANHPLIPILERFKPFRYPARIYAVTFNGAPPVSTRSAQPEAALL
jgi:hypothetical protein